MPFAPSAGGMPFLFTPSDCTFNQALNADIKQFTTLVSYTPVVTSQAGTITSYVASGVYVQYGQLCYVNVGISLTNVGSASGALFFTVPFTSNIVSHSGALRETINSGFLYSFTLGVSSNVAAVSRYDNSNATTWVNNNLFVISFVYGIAI